MQVSSKSCRLCLSESEFNVSLFGTFSRKINLIDKIFMCLKITLEETDILKSICYKCTENIERYYDFITHVKKSQRRFIDKRQSAESSFVKRHLVSSFVHEEVYDADYTFSFLDILNEKQPENKPSSTLFSYFSPPPNEFIKRSTEEYMRKTPKQSHVFLNKDEKKIKKPHKPKKPRHLSRDLFESQSQDVKESMTFDWKLTPDDNIMKQIRDKCFGRSDF